MSEPMYTIDILVHLSNGETITHPNVYLSEQNYLSLFRAQQECVPFFVTVDGKSLGEARSIIAIDFSSPHVVGMEVRVLNKEPAE